MKLYITLTLLTFTCFTYGQDTTAQKPKKISLIGYFGGHYILTPQLHSRLEKTGFEKSAQGFFSFGLGFKVGQRKTFAGVDASVYMIGSELKSNSKAFQLQAFLNHKIIDNNDLSVAPGVDIGLQSMRIDFKRDHPSNNFDTLFLSSGNYVRLRNLTPVAGISTVFHFKKLDSTRNFFLQPFAKVRIGYKYGIANKQWRTDTEIINSPAERLSSFYIQLLAGF